jgi:hypothetical protein
MGDLDLIRGFRAGVKDPDSHQVEAAWAEVLRRLEEQPAPSSPFRRRWLVSAGLAAGVVALALAVPALLPGGGPGGLAPRKRPGSFIGSPW